MPMAFFPWVTGLLATVISIVLIFAAIAWLRAKPEVLKQSGLMLLVVIGVATLSVPAAGAVVPKHWPLGKWSVVACDVGQGDGLVIKSEQRVMVVDTGREPALIDECLRDLEITKIDLLVLTHFDFDHVGGLEGLVRSREVSTAIISGFPDERPATKISLRLLQEKNTDIILANPRLNGKLGVFNWQVLAPSETASEAADSNDASVILALLGPEFDLLLMGDLGLVGQERVLSSAQKTFGNRNVPLILKVSHHGSNDQSSEFHQALQPEIAIVSVGEDNGYGHPGVDALSILSQVGALVLRTDELGAIAISVEQGKILYAGSNGR
jgi:competence protein ComEC